MNRQHISCRLSTIMSGFAGIAFLAGCIQKEGPSGSIKIGSETHINNFGSGPTARQVKPNTPPPQVDPRQIILLSDSRDLLRITLCSEGISAEEKKLSSAIAQLTSGAISANDARVMTSGSVDLRLAVRPKLAVIDQTGDYFRMNCDVEIELNSANTNQVFGVKTIKLVGVRKLGKNNAVAQFDSPASKATAEWCRSELKRIADKELGVAMLTMQLPRTGDGKPEVSYIKSIGDNLGRLPNLVSYEFMGQDMQKGVCTYRVVYFKSAYPNGIANEVSAMVGAIAQHK